MKEIVLYRCQNSGGRKKLGKLPGVREVILGCGGQLEAVHILRAFEDGARGVCVVHCEPVRCRTLQGSRSASRRITYARKLLEEIGFDPERIRSIIYRDGCDLKEELSEFGDRLAEIMGNNRVTKGKRK